MICELESFEDVLAVLLGWVGEPVSMTLSTLDRGIVAAVHGTLAAGTSSDDGEWVFLRTVEEPGAGVFLDRATFVGCVASEAETRLEVAMGGTRLLLDVGLKA